MATTIRLLVCLLVSAIGLKVFSDIDRFDPDDHAYLRLSDDLPLDLRGNQACRVEQELTTCTALRLSRRSTQSGMGHAHSRVSYRLEISYLWACRGSQQLRLTLRAPFLVEHVHLDLKAEVLMALVGQLPLKDVLRLRNAPAYHETNFLVEMTSTRPVPARERLFLSPTLDRRAGPGFIALGFPDVNLTELRYHLGCQNL